MTEFFLNAKIQSICYIFFLYFILQNYYVKNIKYKKYTVYIMYNIY